MTLPTAIETMREAAKRRGPRLPALGSVQPLPPFASKLAPPAVQTASAEFQRALERLGEARTAVARANSRVADVRWADDHEARIAAGKGRKPEPEQLSGA